jgi:predicted unusual protein kinase regulating ubiquinone biosynthesis (AarF/ABC1/UbiB family)
VQLMNEMMFTRIMRSTLTSADEIAGFWKDLARAAGRTVEETQALLTDREGRTDLTASLARLGDAARSQGFLWAGVGLTAQERSSRVARSALDPLRVPLQWAPRALVLVGVAADVYSGYAVLRDRQKRWAGLVGPRDWELQHRRGAARILDAATSLGGVLIKAGQFASVRPDLVPPPYVAALATLQDRVPPRPWAVIASTIGRELGRPPDQIFAEIEQEPVAAASLAQVHRARLPDGRVVAVKVQYPDMPALVEADLAALQSIFAAVARIEPGVRLGPIVDHLRATLPLELDFGREAGVLTALARAMAHRADVLIPPVVEGLGTERLIVTEFAAGIKVSDRTGLDDAGIDPRAVARLLVDVYAEQILRLGLVHADPHPGNLLVKPGPRLVILDHGLTLEVSSRTRRALSGMVRALAEGDLHGLTAAMADAGIPVDEGADPLSVLELAGVLLGMKGAGGIETLGRRVSAGMREVPDDLITIGRALGLLTGIVHDLDPDLNPLEIVSIHVDKDVGSAPRGRPPRRARDDASSRTPRRYPGPGPTDPEPTDREA